MEHSSRVVLNTEGAGKKIKRTAGAVRNLVMRRRIPFRKAGGRLYFFEDELEAWIDKAPGVRIEEID